MHHLIALAVLADTTSIIRLPIVGNLAGTLHRRATDTQFSRDRRVRPVGIVPDSLRRLGNGSLPGTIFPRAPTGRHF